MNTGIQDAFNLGWKLALAVRELAAPGLLDTYGTERHQVARDVVRGTDLATRVLLGRNPLARTFREKAVPALSRLTPIRSRLLQLVSELGISYPASPLSINADSAPGAPVRQVHRGLRAGDRVPDASLLMGVQGNPVSLFSLISQGWLLLLFPGDIPTAEDIATLRILGQEARQMIGDLMPVYLVWDGAHARDEEVGIPALVDPVGALSRVFGAAHGWVTMVRPDGYLGYCGFPEQRLELASYLARVFAMRLRTPVRGAMQNVH